jgi:hypothetical protein
MKLQYTFDAGGNFLIVETICGFNTTKHKYVRYSPDLSSKRVNNEPWRPTTQSDRDWFMKHYLEKFCCLT